MMHERRTRTGEPMGATMRVRLASRWAVATRDGDRWLVEALNANEAKRLAKDGWRRCVVESSVESSVESQPSFDVLSSTVAALEAELDAGTFDDVLVELRAAEVAGKNRTTALAAIDARLDDVGW